MTATTTARRPAPGAVRRVLDIARIQTFHWKVQLRNSLGLLVGGLLVLVVLPALAGDVLLPSFRNGLLIGLCCSLVSLQVQPLIQTFPFVLGLGVTRREFCVATTFVTVGQVAVQAAVLTLLVQVELATDGWWGSTATIAVGPLRQSSAPEQWVFLASVLLAAAAGLVLFGVVQTRWGTAGSWALTGIFLAAATVVLLVTVIVSVVLVAQLGRSGAETLAEAGSSLPLLAGGLLTLAVVQGAASFKVLRRTAP